MGESEVELNEKEFSELLEQYLLEHYAVVPVPGSASIHVIRGTQREPGDIFKIRFNIAKKGGNQDTAGRA